MDVDPGDGHNRQVGGKSLAVDLPLPDAVQGVGNMCAQLLQVQVIDAVADFFVAGETDADRPMTNYRMSRQVSGRFHDDRDAGFVVAAQECSAVGGNNR